MLSRTCYIIHQNKLLASFTIANGPYWGCTDSVFNQDKLLVLQFNVKADHTWVVLVMSDLDGPSDQYGSLSQWCHIRFNGKIYCWTNSLVTRTTEQSMTLDFSFFFPNLSIFTKAICLCFYDNFSWMLHFYRSANVSLVTAPAPRYQKSQDKLRLEIIAGPCDPPHPKNWGGSRWIRISLRLKWIAISPRVFLLKKFIYL